jgi:hypothetical protein
MTAHAIRDTVKSSFERQRSRVPRLQQIELVLVILADTAEVCLRADHDPRVKTRTQVILRVPVCFARVRVHLLRYAAEFQALRDLLTVPGLSPETHLHDNQIGMKKEAGEGGTLYGRWAIFLGGG